MVNRYLMMAGMIMVFLFSLLIGLITAFTGSIMGLGGGIILVPTLLFMASSFDAFAWATPQTIVGISLLVMIFTGLASTLSYLKVKRVDVKTGVLFLIGSIPGGIFGAYLNQFIEVKQFQLYFGILMIFISLLLLLKKERKDSEPLTGDVREFELHGEVYRYKINKTAAIILAFFVGILSGLFGIGGGSVMVPAMILLFRMPVHIAAATSMFMILFVSIIGASTHVILGHIAWGYVLFFIPGAWIGGKLGARVNQLLSSNILSWILRVLLVVIGIQMIVEGLS